ncbi:MAG: ATP-binding protein [Bacteroidales bacterium]|nr:ATP-binding protein [Bacteroidales bacterium]
MKFVNTDPLRVQQILTNLLTNACKHTQAGVIRLGCSRDANTLYFSVEDTGPGIPESEAEHIFERFVKLDEFVQGTGLGLSISREIASKLGGEVHLDTSYSPGARFVFSLPLT